MLAIPITINEIDYEVRIQNGRRSVWRPTGVYVDGRGFVSELSYCVEVVDPSVVSAVIGAYEAQQQAQGKPYQSEVSE